MRPKAPTKKFGSSHAGSPKKVKQECNQAPASPFGEGRRWAVSKPPVGVARWTWIIIGTEKGTLSKAASTHKCCRVEVHPADRNMPGSERHGKIESVSHKRLKAEAVLESTTPTRPRSAPRVVANPRGPGLLQKREEDSLELRAAIYGPGVYEEERGGRASTRDGRDGGEEE